jgi:hypothetical protein
MGDVINLNRFRKQRARSEREETAARNRVRFGRSKEEKARERSETARMNRELEGKKLDDSV